MLSAALPKRNSDDLDGELFVMAYQRKLAHLCAEQVTFLCDEALGRCKWFPTIAECLEIVGEWSRNDPPALRQIEARRLVYTELAHRRAEGSTVVYETVETPIMSAEEIASLSGALLRIGLGAGWLVERDGEIIDARLVR